MTDAADATTDRPEPVYVPHEEFKNGVNNGRFKLIVNPELAYKFVRYKLFINGISIPMLGLGLGAALMGWMTTGFLLVAAAIVLRMWVKRQAPKILLHLVQNDARTYNDAIRHEVLEVQYAR
jgi:hypothetical protein